MLVLDTTVLVGAGDARDDCHDDARSVFAAVASGKPGAAVVTDYILDEALTILSKRRGVGPEAAAGFVRQVLRSPKVRLVPLGKDGFEEALADFGRHGGLGFTDVSTLVVLRRLGCNVLASHDTGFDQVTGLRRVERLPA